MKKIKNLLLTLMLVLSLAAPSSVPLIGTMQTVEAAAKISSKKVTLIKGQKKQLKISGTSKTVKWSSSNKSVAAVTAKGLVTAKKKGSAVITARSGKNKYTCKVTVQVPKISTSKTIVKGDKIRLTVNGTDQKVTWKSSNTKIATVSKSGVITAKKAGTCKIYATVLGKKYTCKITIKNPVAQIEYVWLSATGEKYHKIDHCGRMDPAKARKVTLKEARSRGFLPCSNCF